MDNERIGMCQQYLGTTEEHKSLPGEDGMLKNALDITGLSEKDCRVRQDLSMCASDVGAQTSDFLSAKHVFYHRTTTPGPELCFE